MREKVKFSRAECRLYEALNGTPKTMAEIATAAGMNEADARQRMTKLGTCWLVTRFPTIPTTFKRSADHPEWHDLIAAAIAVYAEIDAEIEI